jgi:hypothetical protein
MLTNRGQCSARAEDSPRVANASKPGAAAFSRLGMSPGRDDVGGRLNGERKSRAVR